MTPENECLKEHMKESFMNQKTIKISIFTIFSVLAGVGFSETWQSESRPELLLGSRIVRNFKSLPLESILEGKTQPWSDTYWPSQKGGIADPYRTGVEAWKFPLPTKALLLSGQYSQEKINELSPAAKFDLVRGYYHFPLTKMVLRETSPSNPSWWGICHGWSPAALNHPEPQPITVVNPDGLSIHFGSSDVKALISYYYADYAYNKRVVRQLGDRCDGGGFLGIGKPEECKKDINAGSFHLVLTNLIGLQHRGFVGDVSQGKQVWNQPIIGYESSVLKEDGPTSSSARGTVKRVYLKTKMKYVVEIEPQEAPVVGTAMQSLEEKTFHYWLELDANGNIIGGEFKNKMFSVAPDFFWTVQPMSFLGEFSALNKIYVTQ